MTNSWKRKNEKKDWLQLPLRPQRPGAMVEIPEHQHRLNLLPVELLLNDIPLFVS
jgi:hypothetical protein